MSARVEVRPSASAVTGTMVGLVGIGLLVAGARARRDVRLSLARERIRDLDDVRSASAARSLAERIRQNTLDASAGRTYAEIEPYLDETGQPTADRSRAARDERTGAPVENPAHELWVQSTTLQTALMQAYIASRLAELTAGLGATFALVGFGLAATRAPSRA
jgi:hypothetical protein